VNIFNLLPLTIYIWMMTMKDNDTIIVIMTFFSLNILRVFTASFVSRVAII